MDHLILIMMLAIRFILTMRNVNGAVNGKRKEADDVLS